MADLQALSVGYAGVTATVADSLQMLSTKGRCAPLFVVGEWGTGKSHMLEFIRSAAVSKGIAHARVDLNARSAALNHPQRFYPWIAESVCLRGLYGLRAIVEEAFMDPARRDSLLKFSWATESGLLGGALRSIILASRELGSDVLIDHNDWNIVMGTDLAPFDYKRSKALTRLGEVAKLLRSVGGSGLVLVLDEAETIDQLWNRLSRMGAYETMGMVCGFDATWAIFGITARFQRCLDRDLSDGLWRHSSSTSAVTFLESWHTGAYRQIAPPAMSDEHAEDLVKRIVHAYGDAYAIPSGDSFDVSTILVNWKSNPSRNPRRLIRSIIDALDAQRGLTPQLP